MCCLHQISIFPRELFRKGGRNTLRARGNRGHLVKMVFQIQQNLHIYEPIETVETCPEPAQNYTSWGYSAESGSRHIPPL